MELYQRVIRSINGILTLIPFDHPEPRNRYLIETNKLKDIPYHIRRYFDVSFIYTDKVRFEACCVLQKTDSTYTIIIIIKKEFETDFQKQEENSHFISRDYKKICRRRELYCHEVCHLIAIVNAFPLHQTVPEKKGFFNIIFSKYTRNIKMETLEKKFFQMTTESLKKSLNNLKTVMDYNIPLSFNDFDDNPSEFDRNHFRYSEDDKTNYFKLFSELMVSDKKLKKLLDKIPEYNKEGKLVFVNKQLNWERCFRDFLHVEIAYVLKKAPEKRDVLFEEIQRRMKIKP